MCHDDLLMPHMTEDYFKLMYEKVFIAVIQGESTQLYEELCSCTNKESRSNEISKFVDFADQLTLACVKNISERTGTWYQ